MKKRCLKKSLSFLIAFCMVFTMLPVSAFGADTVFGVSSYADLQTAVEKLPTDGTASEIIVQQSFTVKNGEIVTIPAGAKVTLNMNEKTIDTTADFEGRPIVNEGNLTVTGKGSIDSSASENGGYGAINNKGTLLIENGTFKGARFASGSGIRNTGSDAVLTVKDGTFEGATCAIFNEGKATIDGGIFKGDTCSTCNNEIWSYTIRNYTKDCEMVINGGEFSGVQGGVSASVGRLEINGGTFKTVQCSYNKDHKATFYALYAAGEVGEVECIINGGTFETVGSHAAVLVGNDNTNGDGGINAQATAHIKGGTFKAPDGVPALQGAENTGDPIITGGTFSSDVSKYVPAGYVQEENGKVSALSAQNAVAEINGLYYETLQDAIGEVEDGETVKLIKDVEESDVVFNKSGEYTLDLGGFTLSTAKADSDIIGVKASDVALNIKNGKLYSDAVNTYGIYVYNKPDGDGFNNVDLKLNGVDLTSMTQPLGVPGNGQNVNLDLVNSIVTCKNDVGIYFPPKSGKLSIDNSKVYAKTNGIVVKGGEVVIDGKDTLISADGPKNIPEKPYGGSSATPFPETGDAVYVEGGYTNAEGNAPRPISVEIKGGIFASANADPVLMKFNEDGQQVVITGGLFSSAPAKEYLGKTADGKQLVTVLSGNNEYPFTVDVAPDTVVKPAVGAPAVDPEKIPDGAIKEDDVEKVVDTAKSAVADASVLNAAAQDVLIKADGLKEDAVKEYQESNLGSGGDQGEEINVYAQTYLDITPKAYDSGKNVLTLDIQPMYRVVASEETDPEELKLKGEVDDSEANAVVLAGSEKKLTNIQTMQVRVTLPIGFKTENMVVKHEAKSGTYYYRPTIDGQTAVFTVTNGFSPFTFMQDTRLVYVKFGDNESVELNATNVGKEFAKATAPAGKYFVGWSFAVLEGTYTKLTDDLLDKLVGLGVDPVIATAQFKTNSGGGTAASEYSVIVKDSANGAVTADVKSAESGSKVTLTATPNSGYELDKLTAADTKGNEVALTKNSDGTYSFKMPASDVTVAAVFAKQTAADLPFTDVSKNDWFCGDVKYVYENGLMNGTSDTTFAPAGITSRGMIVSILYRLENEPAVEGNCPFADVKAGSYYENAITWANANGIVTGYNDKEFGPNDSITREQLSAILYRYADFKGYDVTAKADLSKFTDYNKISSYAVDAVAWANAEGFVNGGGNNLINPTGNAERAQAAAILHRFCNAMSE